MTDEEILKLRSVLLVPDTLEECKRLVQLLWSNLIGSPWSLTSLQRLEDSYYAYKKGGDTIAIEISKEGRPFWSGLNYYKVDDDYYKKFQVIYLNSNKNMEERNITVTLKQAKEWYKSGNTTLKTLALNAYSESELDDADWDFIFKAVTTEAALNDCASGDISKFMVLHKLSIIASYFNKDWKMEAGKDGYFIGERKITSKGVEGTIIEVLCHSSVRYAGIIYFEKKENAEKAMKLLGDDVKYLF